MSNLSRRMEEDNEQNHELNNQPHHNPPFYLCSWHLFNNSAVHGQHRTCSTTVPLLWSAGGLSAGGDSAGQAARIATDASGNVAVVSGPGFYTALVVTSYTANGIFRWRSTVTPSLGTFVGDWVVAAPNGDFIAIGHNEDSHGRPIQSTMVRYNTSGTLLWRVEFSSGFYPAVGRLVVDSAGSAYLTWNSVGNGLFVRSTALPVRCSGRRGVRTAASMPSRPRWC